MSNYAEKMKQESNERFDREMQLRKFRRQFKSQIENGLTLEQARAKYQMSAADIAMFERVQEEVRVESEQGAAFLKGFSNPNFMRK